MLFQIETPIDERTPAICQFDNGLMNTDKRPLLVILQRHQFVLEKENREPCRCVVAVKDPYVDEPIGSGT